MKGSTFKRCTCPPEHDAKGRRKACAKRHGSWSYVVDVGQDPATGKRRQLKKSGFRTQAEAETAMNEVLNEVEIGRYRHDRQQTVRAYLEGWLPDKKAHIRPTTAAHYEAGVKKVVEHLGHMRLRDLQTGHISAMYRKMQAADIGVTTIRNTHTALRSALTDARREGLIRYNPAMDAVIPRAPQRKVRPWSGTELGAFLDHAGGHTFGPIYELMAITGLRRGECLGLRWVDVNLTEGYLTIQQQLTVVDPRVVEPEVMVCPYCHETHRGLAFGPPKTAQGEGRRVDLGEAGIGVLLAQQLHQITQREIWDDAYTDHDLVFADPGGYPWHPGNVTKAFVELCNEVGLRRVRLHDLRHGRASLMLAAGVDIAIVSKVLGHSTIRLTADTYSHLLEGVGKQAAEAADSLIVRQVRDQSVTNQGPREVIRPFAQGPTGPLTSDDASGAKGTRTPNPLLANPIPPVSDGDAE